MNFKFLRCQKKSTTLLLNWRIALGRTPLQGVNYFFKLFNLLIKKHLNIKTDCPPDVSDLHELIESFDKEVLGKLLFLIKPYCLTLKGANEIILK